MQSVCKSGGGQAVRIALLLLALLVLCNSRAAALDLFAEHEVTVQFASQDGKPMANAEVRVFAPGAPNRVVQTGHTDSEGRFYFSADRDGLWTAEARAEGEVARATVRVGHPGAPESEPLSPYYVVGALAVLLAMAVGFRVLRARTRGKKG